MKKLMPFFIGLILFVACDKEDQDANICPTIERGTVPTPALSHFDSTYVGATDIVWFNADSQGYTAVFDLSNVEYEVNYNSAGTFVSQEIVVESQNEGDEEDDDEGVEEACECDRDGGE